MRALALALLLALASAATGYHAGHACGLREGAVWDGAALLYQRGVGRVEGALSCWCVRGCPSCGWVHEAVR